MPVGWYNIFMNGNHNEFERTLIIEKIVNDLLSGGNNEFWWSMSLGTVKGRGNKEIDIFEISETNKVIYELKGSSKKSIQKDHFIRGLIQLIFIEWNKKEINENITKSKKPVVQDNSYKLVGSGYFNLNRVEINDLKTNLDDLIEEIHKHSYSEIIKDVNDHFIEWMLSNIKLNSLKKDSVNKYSENVREEFIDKIITHSGKTLTEASAIHSIIYENIKYKINKAGISSSDIKMIIKRQEVISRLKIKFPSKDWEKMVDSFMIMKLKDEWFIEKINNALKEVEDDN